MGLQSSIRARTTVPVADEMLGVFFWLRSMGHQGNSMLRITCGWRGERGSEVSIWMG